MTGTTIVAVRKGGKVAIAGDGQVTQGETVVKGNAHKVRRLYDDKVIIGFAGSTADRTAPVSGTALAAGVGRRPAGAGHGSAAGCAGQL